MKITRQPVTFEVGTVEPPDGGRQIVIVARIGAARKAVIMTPTRDEARALRSNLGDVLNDIGPGPKGTPAPAERRALIVPFPRRKR